MGDGASDSGGSDSGDEERALAQRHRRWTENVRLHYELCEATLRLRQGIEPRMVNRMILAMSPEEREKLRSLGAIQQERHLKAQEIGDIMTHEVFTREATVDAMYDRRGALTTRQIKRARDRFGYKELEDGRCGRIILSEPPKPNAKH